jgi:WD40 repeat protein/DNA-binding SARP family transcriptional activator/energy-coupling factor transporter ATP-binding protein EcfA2
VGITVLGPLGLEGVDVRLGRRDRVVLSVLAMQAGHTVTPDRLIDALWGDTPPLSAPKVVQGCVMRLRKALGRPAIETSDRGYTLVVPNDGVDAGRFEQMVVRGRELLAVGEADRAAYVLGDALALWRGEPYTDLEGWHLAVIESGRLHALRLDAEELKVEAALRLGHHRDVIGVAHAMVQAAPMRERRWALLAHAQYQGGRQEEALRTIHEVKGLLTQRLGLDPGPDLVALEQAILRQDASLVASGTASPASDTCPYQGLMPYDVGDAESFFGREASLSACLSVLSEVSTVTVVGPSGCGKSSLVRAGIAAALRRQGRSVVVVTPGDHPAHALSRFPRNGIRPILVIDQCEEVFSLCDDPSERAEFATAVVQHAESGLLVIALRADRLADFAMYPSLARLVEKGLHLLGGMSEDGLRAAIESPARQVGLMIEPGLVDLLLREVQDEPGALPMLSHALLETWKRREGNTMTVDGYRATGAIRGAVAQSAEAVYAGIEPGQQHLMRDLLLRLVTHGVEGEPVRSRVPRRLIGSDPEVDLLIDQLVAARLVSSDAGVLEVSHEALARAWPRLRGWLEDDVEGQRILRHLTGASDAWDSMGRPESEVYRGARLAQAIEWRDRRGTHLTDTETAFLEASSGIAQTELRAAEVRAIAQARMIRRLRGVLGVAAVFLVSALLAGLLALRQADRANTSADAATDAARAADAGRVSARALTTDNISLSMLMAVAGTQLDDSSATRSTLQAALAQHPELIGSTPYDGDAITGLEVSPDGRTLAVYDRSGHVLLLAAATMEPLARFDPPPTARLPFQWFAPMAFSPDGKTLAVGLPALTPTPVMLLDAQTLERAPIQLSKVPTQPSRVIDITFSADGSTVAAIVQRLRRVAGYWNVVGHHLVVWNLSVPGRPVLQMDRWLAPDPIAFHRSLVALSPDGDTVFNSAPLSAYDVATGATIYSRSIAFAGTGVPGHNSDFFEINPAGTLLAVTMVPDRLLLLNAKTGTVRRELRGHDERVTGVRFSNDGSLLASLSPDRTAIVWDASTGEILDRLELGEADAQALAFSPDDATLYTGGAGRSIRQWDLQGSRRFVSQIVEPAEFTLSGVTPSPGGRYLAGVGPYGLRFFDMANERWKAIADKSLGAGGWDWNSAGDRFATVGDGYVKVWDPMTAAVVEEARLPGEFVGVTFSADDTRMVIVDTGGRVTVLDGESLEPLGNAVRVGSGGAYVFPGPDGQTGLRLTRGYVNVLHPVFDDPGRGWVLADLETGRVVSEGQVDFDTAWLARSPDGHHAAIGGTNGEVVVVDLVSGEALRPPVVGHSAMVWTMTYSPDGSRIVTTAFDGSASLWDGATGELLGTVLLPERVVAEAEFASDGHTVVIATGYGSVYLWDPSVSHARLFACKLAGRDFTRIEWEEAFGDRPYQETCPQS